MGYTECLLDVLYTDDASFTVGYRAAQSVVGSDSPAGGLAAVPESPGDDDGDDDDGDDDNGSSDKDTAIIVGGVLGGVVMVAFFGMAYTRQRMAAEEKRLANESEGEGETLAIGKQLGAREMKRREDTEI